MTDSDLFSTGPNPYLKECRAAVSAVMTAAKLCRAVQAEIQPDAIEKKDRSPVTLADFGSQALICSMLAESFPGDPIIAEEDSLTLRAPASKELLEKLGSHVRRIRSDADAAKICDWIDLGCAKEYKSRFWTLDPIDGTKGFLRKEQYAIALALVVEGQVEVAALACPNLGPDPARTASSGLVFAAVRGSGAYEMRMDTAGSFRRIGVSAEAQPGRIRFCESVEKDHSSHADAAAVAVYLGIAADPVRLDSQAKYGVVARGGAEAYLRLPGNAEYREKIWDHAAGALIVTEAGGCVTDVTGKPFDFSRGVTLAANRGVVATNGHVHVSILGAIRRI